MNFKNFKEFRDAAMDRVISYLRDDLSPALRELRHGLTQLSFADNFNSFEATVVLPATTEVSIRNQFRDGTVPSKYIICWATGSEVVVGDAEWTKDFVYLQNLGAAEVTVKVIFLK